MTEQTIDVAEQIQTLKEFIETSSLPQVLEAVRKGQTSILIDFAELARFTPEVADLLLDQPEEVLKAMEVAIEQIALSQHKPFQIRLFNLPKTQKMMIREVRSKQIGKLLHIEGIVRTKSDVRPQVTIARFECPACGNVISVPQLDVKFREPNSCSCGRKGKFRLLAKEMVDAQGLILEESPYELEGGEQPKRLNVFLKNDLVSPLTERKTNPGTVIKVFGVLKEVPIAAKDGGKLTRFDLVLDANNIETTEEDFGELIISDEEIKQINELAAQPRRMEKMIDSIAPDIYGHERIKEALVLQLFGGVRKHRRRGDIHVLLLGDPGAGKSALLKNITEIAPKARYVAGKGASGTGLTAAVIKDEFLKGWSLEAGALVLANRGICCLHPHTKVLAGNRLMEIERLFDVSQANEGTIRDESIEFHDRNLEIVKVAPGLLSRQGHARRIRRKWHNGPLLSLTMRSGFKLQLTPDHKLIDADTLEWKEARVLGPGSAVLAPLKLPGHDDRTYLIDILPDDWRVILSSEEKALLRERILSRWDTLADCNREIGLDRSVFSGGGQPSLASLRTLLNRLGIKEGWREKALCFSPSKQCQRLPPIITPSLAYVLGFIKGDGSVHKIGGKHRINITQSSSHTDINSQLRKCWSEIFTEPLREYRVTRKIDFKHAKTAEVTTIEFCNTSPVLSWLHHWLAEGNLLRLSDECLRAYLAGIVDSDGCISTKHCTKKGKRYAMQHVEILVSNDPAFNQLLTLALRRLDCYAKQRKLKAVISLQVTGRADVDTLVRELVPYSVKAKRIQTVPRIIRMRSASSVIPRGPTARLCNEIMKRVRATDLSSRGVWSTVHAYARGERTPSRDQLQRIIERCPELSQAIVEEATTLIQRDMLVDHIVRVEEKQYEGYVYDLYVPEGNNFVAEGIFVHNCIDELDKMTVEDTSSLHEALEQQTISISKANIQATLRAETTVLAAANPKHGRFDQYGSISEQINLPSTLINRFDLIFPIKDLPDPNKDTEMSSFILNIHQNKNREAEIPKKILRKYIAYAKKINPVLTDEAIKAIQEYYLKMRSSGTNEGGLISIPISARQLEGLVRLSEASARARLSDKVTKKDANRAIDLVHYCLSQVGLDPDTGKIDIDKISLGITTSQRNKMNIIKDIVRELENKYGGLVAGDILLQECEARGIEPSKAEEYIEKLNRDGDIIESRKGYWRTV